MGTAAPPCTDRAMRRRQLAARVPIREKLADFCRVAIADNSNSIDWQLERRTWYQENKNIKGRKLSIKKCYNKQTYHTKFAETLTCFNDSACDGKVEAAAFIALRKPNFFYCEKYDISNYLISSVVF